jgi:hypothetical protein
LSSDYLKKQKKVAEYLQFFITKIVYPIKKHMKYEIKKVAGIECIFAPMNDTNSITIEIMCKA